jgi:geranylgeranyl reductase family protein
MRIETDVLVIGLGPAGGAAALAAARGGAAVLAIERKKEIGVPVQCAEWIPLALGRHAQTPGVMVQSISGMETVLPSGAVVKTRTPGLMVNRAAFDQALARAASEAGARLQLNSALKQLDTASRRAWVDTPQGLRECRYKLLIAADGPSSPVASQLGLPRQSVVHARQYTVPLRRPLDETRVWLSAAYPGGYAWLFPKGEVANLGVGMDKALAPDLKTPLDQLHQGLVAEGAVGAETLGRTGGAIPVGGLRTQLVIENVLLVGDAGGFTHPITGAGIDAAVVSGERAGQAAAEWLNGRQNALRDFEDDMRNQFEESLQRAVRRRSMFDPASLDDASLRKGWVAFPEYFLEEVV